MKEKTFGEKCKKAWKNIIDYKEKEKRKGN